MKVFQILAKSTWERFYHVFSSFWENLILKISPVRLDEILGMFLNTLTPKGKYPFEDCQNLLLPFQMKLSEKQKTFSQSLFDFCNLYQVSNILKKMIIVIANVFPKLQSVKILVRPLSKKRYSENALTVNMWKCPKYLRNLPDNKLIMFVHHFERSSFRKCLP